MAVMAPIPEDSYFGPLDKCLAGDQLLISWKAAFCAILNASTANSESNSAIEKFLSSPEVRQLLLHPFKAFPKPSPQSKTVFETKTSAINVTPAPGSRYDIKEIKEDTLWLSKEASIDEVSALRLVVVEWQTRTSTQLLDLFSNEELAGIQDAAGQSQSSLPVALLSRGPDSKSLEEAYDSSESRRLRILYTYLSESRHLLKCVDILLQYAIHGGHTESQKGAAGKSRSQRLVEIGQSLARRGPKESQEFLLECIAGVEANIKKVDSGSGWYEEDGGREEVELEWTNSQVAEATLTMQIIFQTVDISEAIASSTTVLAWLNLTASYGFFDGFPNPEPSTRALIQSLQSITSIISLSLLGLGTCLDYIQDPPPHIVPSTDAPDDAPYILSTKSIARIQNMLLDMSDSLPACASPMLLAWSVILQSIRLRVEDRRLAQEGYNEEFQGTERGSSPDSQALANPDPYEGTIVEINRVPIDDPIQHLALVAVDGSHVFEFLSQLALQLGDISGAHFSKIVGGKMRIVILDLIRGSSAVGYIPEVLLATLSALTGGQNYWDFVDTRQVQKDDDPLSTFLESEELVSHLLISARARYPFEPLPFLKLSRALAASTTCYSDEGSKTIIDFLDKIPSFTQILPDDFSAYETTHEEENNNSIRLTRPVQLFESRLRSLRGFGDGSALMKLDQELCIAAGTYGRMVSESNPRVAYWFHEYSGFKYFGKLLETFLSAGDQLDATTGNVADRDSVAEIIGIFATILLSLSKGSKTNPNLRDEALRILEVASSGLGRNRDITSVVFDIFEEELQKQSTSFGSEVPLEVLTSCVQFIHALIPFTAGRVWPLIGRSGLLETRSGVSMLASIVGSVELVSGRYDFLISCVRLFEALVEDFVANVVNRKARGKSSGRFANGDAPATGLPDQILSKVLLSFARYLTDVLEACYTWKFADQDDCRRLCKAISTTFDRLLHYTYGLEAPTSKDSESSTKSEPKLMGVLEPVASHITDSFLSTTSGSLRFQPFLHTFYDGFNTPDSTFFFNESRLCRDQTKAILTFATTLLRTGVLLEKPPSQLQTQLFKISPLIARLYAVDDGYRIPVIKIFESLIVSASSKSTEPPSLLGNLGARTSKSFLHVLSEVDKPLSREENYVTIMHFASIVVSNRQQWFANYILTGKSSTDALRNKSSCKDGSPFDRPLLNTALDAISSIGDTQKREVLAALEFVALAQNFWPWATYESPKHASSIKALSDFVGTLKPIQPSTTLDGSVDACYQTRIAAYTAEILAMHLFHSRQTGKQSVTRDLVSNLGYFTRFAVAVPQYNSSLHGNLKRNFESRYGGSKLSDLQRSSLETRDLGRDYFYDLPLADKMLSFDSAWSKPQGFGLEVAHANVNLALVDAQIALLHSWKFLAAELSHSVLDEVELQRILAKVASDCLVSNRRSQGSEDIFRRLNETRADLALVLVQRLVEVKSTVPDQQKLLSTVWETIRQSNLTFEVALGTPEIGYYRLLLKLLFLALQVHAANKEQSQSSNADFRASTRLTEKADAISTVLDIFHRVVANGLRDLAAFIHEKPGESSPTDLALITAILQAGLRISGIELAYSQIVSTFVQNDSARVATTLFSWSDSLAIDGDPIYGELSILFLLELSAVPAMAEQLAIDGVLGHIGAANITSFLRRSNVSPFAEGAGFQRCYSIWVRGILPLLLHMLDAVGASIASEVAVFLAQFPNLLDQASQAFDAPELSRTASRAQTKYITLSICSEIHSLSLIMFILNGFREEATGMDIPEVKWDAGAVLENVEFWLGTPAVLRERILPMGEREASMSKKKSGDSAAASRLEEKVVAELRGIRDVLGAGEA